MSATSSTTSISARDRARRITSYLDAAVERGSFIVGEQVRRLEAHAGELTGREAVCVSSPAVGLLLLLRTRFTGAVPVLATPATPAGRAIVDGERRLVQRASRLWADAPAGTVLVGELGEQTADPVSASPGSDVAGVVRLLDMRRLDASLRQSWAADRIAAADALVLHASHDYSFAAGDTGIVACDPETARRLRVLRNHGRDGLGTYLHAEVGFNNRMDEVQAGMLLDRLTDGSPSGDAR